MTPGIHELPPVAPEEANARLDRILARHFPGTSRSFLQRCIHDGRVAVGGETIRQPAFRPDPGAVVRIDWPPEEDTSPLPEDIPLDVIYEDDAMLVVNKPAGLVIHPAPGNRQGTLVSALLHRDPAVFADLADDENEDGNRPGIVHRLDKETSGLLVVAKTAEAAAALRASFKAREVAKLYLAVVRNRLREPDGAIDLAIGRDPKRRMRMAAFPAGAPAEAAKPALTKYRVIAQTDAAALLLVRLYTGRTHQIRVHFAALRHPVLGDTVYGGGAPCPPFRFERQLLHAWKLSLPHPVTREPLVFLAPPPQDLRDAIAHFTRATGIAFDPAR